jgi:predicted TIM-barrel fold metal-dependent hydrolase
MLATIGMARAEAPQFIDTQAQFDPAHFNYSAAVETMLSEMDRVGISKTLIVPPPFARTGRGVYDAEEIVKFVKAQPTRFNFLAGGGSLNPMIQRTAPDEVTDGVKESFKRRCEAILAMGAIGFGEVTAEHLSLPGMGELHPYESTAPDHPLLLLLADIAAERDVPIDIHFDVFPTPTPAPPPLRRNNPAEFKENLEAFERLLAHNPKARFNWAHVGSDPGGQRAPKLMRELLARHPNLYSAFRIVAGGAKPIQPLDDDERLKPAWEALIRDFPDRFTLHTDIFYTSSWPPDRGPKRSHELARKLLEQLPPDLAAKLAYENARRIYKLSD